MTLFLLICHGLLAVALLGAITHQAVNLLAPRPAGRRTFTARYAAADSSAMPNAVMLLYVVCFIFGGVIYPNYRLDVRIPLEEMRLGWALGLFELKEHFGGIGLATLPLYAFFWRDSSAVAGRRATTLLLAITVWFDFLAGHVINNVRGL